MPALLSAIFSRFALMSDVAITKSNNNVNAEPGNRECFTYL